MPKIIENLEARFLEEAKKQIREAGYSATTIRSIAKGCGVGVGTVYNYFPSKDALLATYMLQDWNRCMDTVQAVSAVAQSPERVIRCICGQLAEFSSLHETLFRDEAAAASFAGAFSQYHSLLRSQLAAPVRRFCSDSFSAEFIAEALLTWTMEGKTFDEIYGVIQKLF